MKTYILACAALTLLLTASVDAAHPEVVTVAIFDFESKDESIRDFGPKIAALVNAHLSAEPRIITVERADLEKVLGEQELGLSGTVSADTAARVGHLTGAKVLVTGRVFKAEKELVVVTKIIGTETSRVYGEVAKGAAAATSITDLSAEVATKIARKINDNTEALIARGETREQRIERLLKNLKAGKRGSVSVKIPEQHFGARVPDPAAETEIGLLLQRAGFTLLDEKSTEKPDIEITGEAFSATGLRKGNLVACKARVELKAHDRKSGKILAVDRQTSVAVDLTEQTAAKTALQNAAADLSERLLPKLVE